MHILYFYYECYFPWNKVSSVRHHTSTDVCGNWIEIAYGTSSGTVRVIVQHPETVGHGPQLFQTFTVHRFPVTKVCNSKCSIALLVKVIKMAFYVALVCAVGMNDVTRFAVLLYCYLITLKICFYEACSQYCI